ncbi:MAG: bifunctional nuclease family protein [Bacteroidia bacterium]|nr:bifunctional nuclease family protein [Bacteroidia bacterium]
MKKIELDIVGISYSQTQSGAYALILGEKAGTRRVPIIIGGFEAQSIAIELEKMVPSRPLTHDLFKTFAEAFQITIKEVIIHNLVEGIFYSRLICVNEITEEEKEIDARTSDAVALAIRFKCPIYTYEFILKNAGIELDDENTPKTEETPVEHGAQKSENWLSEKSLEELKQLLQKAIENEDYELASKIRDEINQRKKS